MEVKERDCKCNMSLVERKWIEFQYGEQMVCVSVMENKIKHIISEFNDLRLTSKLGAKIVELLETPTKWNPYWVKTNAW